MAAMTATTLRGLASGLLGGIAALACASSRPPLATAPHVDLDRFMGDWFVIASIPTWFERDAHDAVESYRRAPDGTIETTFRFRRGGFDAPIQTYEPKGFVRDDPSNAVWGMQFVWPVKAEYLILEVADDYGHTVVGRNRRDHVWIMARAPRMPEADYERIVRDLDEAGYDTSRLVKVPHRAAGG
jgi:apolipoprotein D and lipocalin family protein